MCGARLILAAACAAVAALAQPGIPREEYRARRAELRKEFTGGVLAIFGQSGRGFEAPPLGQPVQAPDFLYLAGWEEPGAILLMWPADGEMLLLPPRDERQERYTGPKTAAEDANARTATGFDQVLPATQFETQLLKRLESHPRLGATAAQGARLKELAPLREVTNIDPLISRLRMKKSPGEVELIRRAIEVTIEAHRAAWKRAQPGVFEYQVAATFTATVMERGCVNGFRPIVGAGPNALTLHYWKNARPMEAGELLVLDAGAECAAYTADITRTVPVSGKFTPRQRELYEIVLGAEQAVIAAIKPGITQGRKRDTPNSLYKVAYDYIDSRGKDRSGNSLGKYLPHGVSHHVGLQVHDPGAPDQPLEAGMVITVEPGLYLPEEGLGIRIEDMVLVTEQGAKVLTSTLPKQPAEIERALAK